MKIFAILVYEVYIFCMKQLWKTSGPALFAWMTLLLMALPVYAEFDAPILDKTQALHEEIIISGQRNINGADMAALWGLFDADALRSLNGGITPPLTINKLNAKYGLTDIRIPLKDVGEEGDMKTGGVRIEFFELPGSSSDKPHFLAVYYHGLGAVPASTFHIFRYKRDRYELGAAMETSDFLSDHPKLQWNAIQIRNEKKPGHFSSYFNAGTKDKNRAQVRWHYDGKKLRALRWYPEVDYHKNKKGTRVSGRGDPILLD
jgi:hypothetical protein